ncbi:MAG: hypothetical protein NQ082_11680, partial [Stenotrophomonas maltophilia]|nr:hypothetical protein [Stenotrophomonas maltophilia]
MHRVDLGGGGFIQDGQGAARQQGGNGKRIGARDAVRMGRSGERNTRGDTNWVPAEMIERIEVLR